MGKYNKSSSQIGPKAHVVNSNRYDHKNVEAKWQSIWQKIKLDQADIDKGKKPFYNLMMFPYPSAEGLHVGNMYAFTGSDIYGRFKRMHGHTVFEPIGLDGFGIHSENYALKIGRHPVDHAAITEKSFYNQLHRIGAMFDWSRTVETYHPSYYKWTQWLFVEMFKHGFAYRGKAQVNWCPSCKTVLADEQVIDARCERCGNAVIKRLLEQWFFKITAYAEKLLQNSFSLDWSEKIRVAQQRWIGKKEGIKIQFGDIEIFTTRPETILGATFVVLSPAHPLAGKVKEVVNPATKKVIPVFVDEYVLGDVGTGAIMAVPSYDDRDRAFAKRMGLPIVRAKLTQKRFGEKTAIYHLRDWLISRQRYWGPPIPMIYCENCHDYKRGEKLDMPGWYAVPQDELPVVLPRIEDYKPGDDGIAPLAKHKEFYETKCPGCGGKAVRETDVSDTFLDSSWYFLRYPSLPTVRGVAAQHLGGGRMPARQYQALAGGDSSEVDLPFDSEITKKWLPVDMYTGGAEHSVLHLMYSRFITMALKDWGYIDFEEPFSSFYAHGLIIKDGAKMSKSKGNVVNPDEYIDRYGADSLRLYLMFTGPYDQGGDFRDSAMEGMARWVGRIWRLATKNIEVAGQSNETVQRALQKLVNKVSHDIEKRRYNTAIASMMEFTNLVTDHGGALGLKELGILTLLLAPFAPHLAEELWQKTNNISKDSIDISESVHIQPWPELDDSSFVDETVTIVVQVNGKVRDIVQMESEKGKKQTEVEPAARTREKVKKFLDGKSVKKAIFVPGKLINFVIS